MAWDPAQYLHYADERQRPAVDLLARVPLATPGGVLDLGCGPGNTTALLAARFPNARLTGVDTSPAMLERAQAAGLAARFIEADAASFEPEEAPDLIYSNAALHWLDDHDILFPRLMGLLAPGGALAVQMPNNFTAPSHTLLSALSQEAPWLARFQWRVSTRSIATPTRYVDWLAPLSTKLDIWHSEYWQVLQGPDPVLAWIRGSALRPFLDALPEEHRPAFEDALAARLSEAYPVRPDGTTLFPFRRLFIIAQR